LNQEIADRKFGDATTLMNATNYTDEQAFVERSRAIGAEETLLSDLTAFQQSTLSLSAGGTVSGPVVLAPLAPAATPLTVKAAPSGTADIMDVTDANGATRYFQVDLNGNVNMSGSAHIDAVNIATNASIGSNVNIGGKATVGGNATVNGSATINGMATLNGGFFATSAAVQGSAQVGAGLAVGGNAVIGGLLQLVGQPGAPTCDASKRGALFFVQGGSGVQDQLLLCAKDASDSYAWRTVF
jgi:hypothetical protein